MHPDLHSAVICCNGNRSVRRFKRKRVRPIKKHHNPGIVRQLKRRLTAFLRTNNYFRPGQLRSRLNPRLIPNDDLPAAILPFTVNRIIQPASEKLLFLPRWFRFSFDSKYNIAQPMFICTHADFARSPIVIFEAVHACTCLFCLMYEIPARSLYHILRKMTGTFRPCHKLYMQYSVIQRSGAGTCNPLQSQPYCPPCLRTRGRDSPHSRQP